MRLATFSLSGVFLLSACSMIAPAPPDGQKFVVFFTEWSAAIDPGAESAIRSAAEVARAHPESTVAVAGFADPVGSPDANLQLSRTRAQVVYDQLVHDGVTAGRIQRNAMGRTDYALDSQESRRVEITVAQ